MTVFTSSKLMRNIILIEPLIQEIKAIRPTLNDDDILSLVLSVLDNVE